MTRGVVREVELARGRGVSAAARVSAAAFVSHTAMGLLGGLTAEEVRLVMELPFTEPRAKAIVDTFTRLACAEIERVAR